jgi:glycosyltransferase involved in cell wall biosynthesis
MSRVSIIITTKNEEHNIERCLRSIKKQTYKEIECVVVDNRSTDGTEAVARRFTKLVYQAGPERSAQRNFGAKKASGTFLLFLDADMELSPNVVEDCIVKSKQYNSIIIPEESIGGGFWSKCKALEREFYIGVDWIEAARWYTKKDFLALGGYNESLTGPEDFELSQRFKTKFSKTSMGRISSYIVHNEGHIVLSELLRKKYYYGKQMHKYSRLTESSTYFTKQSNILKRYWLFLKDPFKLLQSPILSLGMFTMKTLEMIAMASGSVGL